MLDLLHINKKYPSKIVFSDTQFKVNSGEIVLLTGKSGIGKSTLLDIIAGIKRYDSGTYFYQNQEIHPEDDEKMSRFRNQNIGYILQDFALIKEYTVAENIILPTLYNRQFDKNEAQARALFLANKFDLSDVYENKIRNVSGGQKQRCAIARSLILDPAIVLADEPTTNLDTENLAIVMDTFVDLKRNAKTVIIATHDERMSKIADKVYEIFDYKINEILEK